MPVLNNRDIVSGLAFVALGTAVALYTHLNHDLGSLRSMGPGFFPFYTGLALAVVGALTIALAWGKDGRLRWQTRFGWRSVLAVLGSIAAFALLIDRLGLWPASMALTVIASMARPSFNWGASVRLGVVLGVLAWVVFILGLKMNLTPLAWSF